MIGQEMHKTNSEILKFSSDKENEFRQNMITYIKTYFKEELSDQDLKLLESDEGLATLTKKIQAKLAQTKFGNA